MKYLLSFSIMMLLSIGCKDKIVVPADTVTYKNVDVADAKDMMTNIKDLIILDVRTPGETDQGIIPNAIVIDYRSSNFDSEIAKLDKSKSYLVYCKSGGRSVSASKKMIDAGFTKVTNMKGGYSAWK